MSNFGTTRYDPYHFESDYVRRYYGDETQRKRYEPTLNQSVPLPYHESQATRDDFERKRSSSAAPERSRFATHIRKDIKLITLDYRQKTPWCRDMYKWFTPDPSQGVCLDIENVDQYRLQACKQRLTAQRIFHVHSGLIPGYYGHVPGQKFRYGNTWTKETENACKYGTERLWESTSFFETRAVGP